MSTDLRPYRLLGTCLKVLCLLMFLAVIVLLVALYSVNQRSDWTTSLLQRWQPDLHQLRYEPVAFSQQDEFWLLSNNSFFVSWQAYKIRGEQLTMRFRPWSLWPEDISVKTLAITAEKPSGDTSNVDEPEDAGALPNIYQELQTLRDIQAFNLAVQSIRFQQGQNVFEGNMQWQHQHSDTLKIAGRSQLPEFSETPIEFSTELNIHWQEEYLSLQLDSELQQALTVSVEGSSASADEDWNFTWQADWSNKALLAIIKEMQALPLDIHLEGDNINADGQFSVSAALDLLSVQANLHSFADQHIELEYGGERFSLAANMPELAQLEWRNDQLQVQLGELAFEMDKAGWGEHRFQIQGKQACIAESSPCVLSVSGDSRDVNLSALNNFISLPDAEAVLRSLQWQGELSLDVAGRKTNWSGGFQGQLDGLRVEKNGLETLALSLPEVRADVSLADSSLSIQLAAPTLTIVANTLTLDDVAEIKTVDISLENIQAASTNEIALDFQWRLSAQKVRAQDTALGGAMAQGKISLAGEGLQFSGDVLSDLAEPLLAFNGLHRMGDKQRNGSLEWRWKLAPFSPDSSLEKRFGRWPLDFNALGGEINGGGEISWQLGETLQWQAKGQQALLNIGGVYNDIGLVDLSVENTWSFASNAALRADGQVSLSSLDVGLPVENIALSFGFKGDAGLTVEGFKAELLDGSVHSPSLQLSQREGLWESELALVNIRAIKLESLLKAADYAGLDATANLSGELPVAIRANKLHIEEGKLAATQPGYIRYAGLADSGNPLMEMVSEALSNYQYEHLTADVEYDDSGYLQMAVALKGHNPDFQKGRQVNLNLNISDNVPNLMKSLQAGRIITDVISEKLDQ
ncbi:intermembrane phospholipid transport protein YdbH family protein [Pseudoteredinibacter isoporae]|uniref:Dicarboxylate transport domain-containing protein n=1 Tax=Pseudoteredinibacter isoporae TaxID=570281 RepID=A0A7X0JWH6_9GAMM|nr:YdbH domain-containing protein [Pseudoteredinibacter isoporae]MBB6522790.1 hypothetical protein [Pseudoteredinibacter isoporae]NHO88317.1 hypothetical protein [Pseudoteredinibacter isoporae]NIB23352.1 hypothetical protein [Pseudoteredinibacter isoporae]